MKKLFVSLVLFAAIFNSCKTEQAENYDWLANGIDVAAYQLKLSSEEIATVADSAIFPRSIKNGERRLENMYDWTSGFFPGSLWLEYELTGDDYYKTQASKFTNRLHGLKDYKGTHDLGFMVFCSFGNAERLSPNDSIKQVLIDASESLTSRYNDTVKCIRSWDFGEWSYPVIIDNMMNLKMLFYTSEMSKNDKYKNIAIQHANTSMKNHFRDDFSSYHVISYVPSTGAVESKGTFQGFADESAWARGQAWAVYGYLDCYEATNDKKYLDFAINIANFIMKNVVTEDLIPYWDYNAPNIPDAPRDASAAAITSAALLKLSTLIDNGNDYFTYAETILKNLSSDKYLAKKGENKGFILMHSVGHLPANSEIDTPLNYADYYYLESILRYADIKKIDTKKLEVKK